MGLFGNTLSSSNHDSPVGMLGSKGQQWTDPIAWLPGGLGKKWVNLTSNEIPKMTNEVLSPVAQIGGKIDKAVNPLRKIPAVDNVMNTVEAKPADAIGTALGAYFAAPALAGIGGSSGAAGGGLGGGVGGAGAGTGDALGSFAGLSGQSGAVMGGGGAISSVAPGVTAGGSTALGSTAGMSGTFGPVAGGFSPMLSQAQAQLLGKALNGMGQQQGGGQQQTQLGAANSAAPQATISAPPTVPTVNPALRQQIMANMLMRGY